MSKLIKQKGRKIKAVKIRIEEKSLLSLQKKAVSLGISVNGYISFLLNSTLKKEEVSFDKKVNFDEKINQYEKREVKAGVSLTKSEAELLDKYAVLNDWSIAKEVRYRTLSTLAKKPKLSKEELRIMYAIRSSINILGANINRLLRNNQVIADHNINVCKKLLELIKEQGDKIDYLEKCSHTHFKLKSF